MSFPNVSIGNPEIQLEKGARLDSRFRGNDGFSLLFVLIFSVGTWAAPGQLDITPKTFNFGWAPHNEKISCEFIIRNPTPQMIPIIEVRPACGCTAADFTPADLSSMDEMTIGLTFNTRGYDGRYFHKPSKVKTEEDDQEYQVYLKGFVSDPQAVVVPKGGGVAGFEPGSKEKTKTIPILNLTDKNLTLSVVQKPASWAEYKLVSKKIKPGQTVNLVVEVEPPFQEKKYTSITLEAKDKTETHRLTVAIRTGPPPRVHRPRIKPKK